MTLSFNKNFSSFRFTKFFFTTAFLVVALSASSFAGPKRVETTEQMEARLAAKARAQPAAQQRAKDATAVSSTTADGASSSSTAKRGTELAAVDPSLQPVRPKTTGVENQLFQDELQEKGTPVSRGAGNQRFTGQPTPPGIAMTQVRKLEADNHSASSMIGIEGPLVDAQASHDSGSLTADLKEVPVPSSATGEGKSSGQQLKEALYADLKAALANRQQSADSRTTSAVDEFAVPLSTAGTSSLHGAASAAAAAAVESTQEEQKADGGYLTREGFVNLLNQDSEKWIAQLEPNVSDENVKENLKVSILNQVVATATRLSNKYNDQNTSSLDSMPESELEELPSIRALQEKVPNEVAPPTDLPRKKMTPLEFDQEFYGAIKDAAAQALSYSESGQQAKVLDSLDRMTYLDSYSQLQFDRDKLLDSVRVTLRKNYEKLIVQSFQQGESKHAGVTSEGQEEAHNLVGFKKLWDFEKNIKENKLLLQSATVSLADPLPRFIAAGNTLGLVQKAGKTTLQLPIASREIPIPVEAPLVSQGLQVGDALSQGSPPSAKRRAELLSSDAQLIDVPLQQRQRFYRTLPCILSVGTVAAIAAALAYEWYLHSLHASSSAASS